MTGRKLIQHPVIGFFSPWFLIIVLVFLFHGYSSSINNIWLVFQSCRFEVLREYAPAAECLEAINQQQGPDLIFWKADINRSAGNGALMSGNFKEGIKFFSKIISNPENIKTNCSLNSNFKRAVFSTDYFALLYRGICYQKEGQVIKARADWMKAISAFPNRHDAWLAMGHSLILENDLLGAQTCYLHALALSGQLGSVYVDIGDAWRYIGQPQLAQTYYQRGLSPDPADVFCRLRLGEMALIVDNNPEKAIHFSAIIQRMMPDLTAATQLKHAAQNWTSDSKLEHIPAARFSTGQAHQWKISPTKIYFEFFRPNWNGWQ